MAEPHTDTGHDDGTALAVALIGLFLIAALLVMPWFVGDSWTGAWRQEQVPMGLPVEQPKAGLPVPDEDAPGSSDPPPYAFVRVIRTMRSAPDTPNLSNLCVVPS